MSALELFPLKIWQKDHHVFSITWNDGQRQDFRLADVQRECPCAICASRLSKPIEPEVQAVFIRSVGRYGLRIQFTQGCSAGIYSFELLRQLAPFTSAGA